jgi:hypothetical protein
VLGLIRDPLRRKEMRANVRAFVQDRFFWRRMADQIEAQYLTGRKNISASVRSTGYDFETTLGLKIAFARYGGVVRFVCTTY